MAKLDDRKILCLFSILCFGKQRETPILGQGCKAYDFNYNIISVHCEDKYQLTLPSTVRDIHTLFLEGITDEEFNTKLIDLPFKHLIIKKWDMSSYFKDSVKTIFTLHQRQSLTASEVNNLQAWRWSDYEFEQMHIKKSSLTRIGSQRLSDLLAKRLFSNRLIGLYLIECQLLSIDENVFSHTYNLKTLTISHNTLSSITGASFPNPLENLWLLDLSYNSLNYIYDDLFIKFPSLLELNLNGNHLTDLPFDLIKPIWFHLNLIQLLENNWYCENFCWSTLAQSFPHPISFDTTNCSTDYLQNLLVGTMNRYFPICFFPWNLSKRSRDIQVRPTKRL